MIPDAKQQVSVGQMLILINVLSQVSISSVRTRACGVEGDVQHCLWATTLKQSSGCYQ